MCVWMIFDFFPSVSLGELQFQIEIVTQDLCHFFIHSFIQILFVFRFLFIRSLPDYILMLAADDDNDDIDDDDEC